MWWQEPFLGVWSQILYWIGQCGNRNEIVISRVSILVSGLVASQVTLSFYKLETGLRSWGGKSLKWQKHPALCDCFYGWMLLKPVLLRGGTDDESAGWGSVPNCLQEMKLSSLPLTSLVPEHFYWSICLPYRVIYGALAYVFGLWLPLGRAGKINKSSLKTLGLNQGYHKITQLSAVTVLSSVLWTIFAVLLWCENTKLF